jgi:hypothetical protein
MKRAIVGKRLSLCSVLTYSPAMVHTIWRVDQKILENGRKIERVASAQPSAVSRQCSAISRQHSKLKTQNSKLPNA